jgi:hypothetical protein
MHLNYFQLLEDDVHYIGQLERTPNWREYLILCQAHQASWDFKIYSFNNMSSSFDTKDLRCDSKLSS